MTVPKHQPLFRWYPQGLIVHQQRFRPSDSNKNVDFKFSAQDVFFTFLNNILLPILNFILKYTRKIKNKLFDKSDDFIFPIVNLPFMSNNSLVHMTQFWNDLHQLYINLSIKSTIVSFFFQYSVQKIPTLIDILQSL